MFLLVGMEEKRDSMTARQHRSLLVIVAVSTLLILCLLSVFVWFGFALGQAEQVSTTTLVLAATRLEMTGKDIIPLKQNIWLEQTYKNGKFQQNGDALDKLLAERGWKHTDQEGSGRVYTKGDNRLDVVCHRYSRHYQVCTAVGS